MRKKTFLPGRFSYFSFRSAVIQKNSGLTAFHIVFSRKRTPFSIGLKKAAGAIWGAAAFLHEDAN